MADVQQIYAITNSLTEQALGVKDLEPTDATFVSVGKLVLSSDENKESWYKTACQVIGRTVSAVRAVEEDMTELDLEPFVFGAILRKFSFKMPIAQQNPAWNSQTDPHTDPFAKSVSTIKQEFFNGLSTWEVPLTVPDRQLEMAFHDAQSMAAFLDGIYLTSQNAMQTRYNQTGYLVRASQIGAVIHSANPVCYVNLLKNYNATVDTADKLTVTQALKNMDFLKYASQTINLYSDRMAKMSTTFNIAGWERRTPKNLQICEMLAEFVSSFNTYLQADTFHNELTKLRAFKSVPYWQGSGMGANAWSFAQTSSIDVIINNRKADGSIEEIDVQGTGIVCVLRDIDAIATTIDNRRTTSIWNPHDEYNNYWYKANIGWMRDVSENFVVFTIEDETENAAEIVNSLFLEPDKEIR